MEVVKLGSLTNRKIGYGIVQPGESVVDGIPVIKVNNIIAGLRNISELDTTKKENDEKYSRTRLKGGELLLSVVGTIGKTAVVPMSFAGCNLVRATALIDIPDSQMTKWVKYYINSPRGQYYIHENLNTTVQPTLNIKSIVDMPIPLFSNEYMEKATRILSSLDDKIEVNRRINENLEAQAQALFKSWFVDFEPFRDGEFVESEHGMIPKGWRVGKVDDIIEISKKSISPIKSPNVLFSHYSIPAYDNGKQPESQFGKEIMSNKFLVHDRMILFSKLNPKIKRIWYVENVPENSICSTEFVPYVAKDITLSAFVYSLISSQGFYDFVMSMVNGATGSHQRFHPEEALLYQMAYNEDVAVKFSKIVEPMISQILNNQQESRRLATLRDTLLPRLMSGELKVNEIEKSL